MLTKLKRLVNAGNELGDKSISNGFPTNNSVNALPINLQRKFARGVSYNLKIIVKGDRNVGKSALLDRMQHLPFCEEYVPTDEIKVVNINWDHKLSDEVVKVELWEIVDKAKKRETDGSGRIGGSLKTSNSAFSLSNAPPSPGIINQHQPCMALDAESIDVYRGASGVIVIIDLTKKWTVDYLQREIGKIPPNLPVLVLANHKDMYHHAVVTGDQVRSIIAELSATRKANSASSAPDQHEGAIIYAESSMRNGFGLKFVDKFFSIPFLYLQRATLLAQLQTNARDIRAMHQELNLNVDNNYDAFIEQLTNNRRAAADEHAKSAPTPVIQQNLPVPNDNITRSLPKSPPPGTSIAETIPVKELMSNPKYKIEYPTLEQQISWQHQQQLQQQRQYEVKSSQKPKNSTAEPTKTRPSIIIGGGKPIPGSNMLLMNSNSAPSTNAAVQQLGNESTSDDADEFEVVLPQKTKKAVHNNPMVAHSSFGNGEDDDNDDDTISVDYQQGGTTAGEALDAVESRAAATESSSKQHSPRIITGSRNDKRTGADLFSLNGAHPVAVNHNDSTEKQSATNDAGALEILADIARRQSAVEKAAETNVASANSSVRTDQRNLSPVVDDENNSDSRGINVSSTALPAVEAKKPRKAKKNSGAAGDEKKRVTTKRKSKKIVASTSHDDADATDAAVSRDIYKDYEPI